MDGAFCHYCRRAACECPEPAPIMKGPFAIPTDHPAILTTYNAGESVTLDPHDAVQAMIEEIKKLSAENAAMKAMLESRGFTVVNGRWARTEETV